jgi:dihydrofolate synthase/folylpolyglutamate synthase
MMTLGLGNMREILQALGHPEQQFRSVLVAGTNGKGSVTAYMSAILKNNGLRVGSYTSPHIYNVAERIQIDCTPVTLDEMERAAARIVPLRDRIAYSYFEALTAIAFLIFAERGVEIAVLETGLGGRFDATNTVEPEVCVLTHVGLDHRRILGDTEEEILREKLGIARTGTPFLVGPISRDLLAIVAERARQDRVPLVEAASIGTIELETLSFSEMRARIRTRCNDYGGVPLPFLGEHQLANALLAVGAAEKMIGPLNNLDIAANDVYLDGRFEVRKLDGKRVILDVAHNDDALIAAAQTLGTLSPAENNALVLGILSRKELLAFPRRISQWSRRLFLVQPSVGEWLPAPSILERIGLENVRHTGLDVLLRVCLDSDAAWERLIDELLGPTNPTGVVLITGSHRTVELFGRRLWSRQLK